MYNAGGQLQFAPCPKPEIELFVKSVINMPPDVPGGGGGNGVLDPPLHPAETKPKIAMSTARISHREAVRTSVIMLIECFAPAQLSFARIAHCCELQAERAFRSLS
jgi:hypothetical protein